MGGALALAAAGCSPAIPERSNGGAPTFVSLNPCVDAILVEVATPAQILALSHYSRDRASSSVAQQVAARHAFTGGTAEEIIALAPDIVLASSFIAPATRAALERSGLRVETFSSPTSEAESDEQVERLARLTGNARRGAEVIRRIHAGPPRPPFRPPGDEISALLWQPGQIVPGEATLIAEQMEWAGLTSHSAAIGLEQADYVSLEAVLADPPQILLVAGDQAGQVHPLLDSLSDTMVAPLDPRLLYCGGPTIPKVRERLVEIRKQYERRFGQGRT